MPRLWLERVADVCSHASVLTLLLTLPAPSQIPYYTADGFQHDFTTTRSSFFLPFFYVIRFIFDSVITGNATQFALDYLCRDFMTHLRWWGTKIKPHKNKGGKKAIFHSVIPYLCNWVQFSMPDISKVWGWGSWVVVDPFLILLSKCI